MIDVPVTIAWKNRVLENRREIEASQGRGRRNNSSIDA
jgi:hypothetical protein